MEARIFHSNYANLEVIYWNLLQTPRNLLRHGNSLEKGKKCLRQSIKLWDRLHLYWSSRLYFAGTFRFYPFQNELILTTRHRWIANKLLSVFWCNRLNNLFIHRYFPEANWEQMFWKAIFMQRPLFRIQSARSEVSCIGGNSTWFCTWAMGCWRDVMPELWRLLPHLSMHSFQRT